MSSKPTVKHNLPEIAKRMAYKANRDGVAERFPNPAVQKSIEVDMALTFRHLEGRPGGPRCRFRDAPARQLQRTAAFHRVFTAA